MPVPDAAPAADYQAALALYDHVKRQITAVHAARTPDDVDGVLYTFLSVVRESRATSADLVEATFRTGQVLTALACEQRGGLDRIRAIALDPAAPWARAVGAFTVDFVLGDLTDRRIEEPPDAANQLLTLLVLSAAAATVFGERWDRAYDGAVEAFIGRLRLNEEDRATRRSILAVGIDQLVATHYALAHAVAGPDLPRLGALLQVLATEKKHAAFDDAWSHLNGFIFGATIRDLVGISDPITTPEQVDLCSGSPFAAGGIWEREPDLMPGVMNGARKLFGFPPIDNSDPFTFDVICAVIFIDMCRRRLDWRHQQTAFVNGYRHRFAV